MFQAIYRLFFKLRNFRVMKYRKPAEIILTDGTIVSGSVFLVEGQRPIDMLNDRRDFIPFELPDSSVVFIQKHLIIRMKTKKDLLTPL
jgi:hypothetical protein